MRSRRRCASASSTRRLHVDADIQLERFMIEAELEARESRRVTIARTSFRLPRIRAAESAKRKRRTGPVHAPLGQRRQRPHASGVKLLG